MNISRTLRKIRLNKDLSQKELAYKMGVKPSTISAWERGQNIPNIADLFKLSNIFGEDLYALIGENNPILSKDIKYIDLNQFENDTRVRIGAYEMTKDELISIADALKSIDAVMSRIEKE